MLFLGAVELPAMVALYGSVEFANTPIDGKALTAFIEAYFATDDEVSVSYTVDVMVVGPAFAVAEACCAAWSARPTVCGTT